MTKVITIAQQKGGAGKTTLAAHLGIAWSQRGKRVAFIDIDPQGSLSTWHKLREERFGEGYTGVTFKSVSGWRVASEISNLKRSHDVIVIDSPPHTETEAKAAIRSADLVVIPVQPSPQDVWATQATLSLADREGLPAFVVLNRLPASSKLADTICASLPKQCKSRLGNRVAFATAFMEGRTVTETQPSSLAAFEVKQLSEEIWKRAFGKEEKLSSVKTQKKQERILEDA